jgi:hypothetical protein
VSASGAARRKITSKTKQRQSVYIDALQEAVSWPSVRPDPPTHGRAKSFVVLGTKSVFVKNVEFAGVCVGKAVAAIKAISALSINPLQGPKEFHD